MEAIAQAVERAGYAPTDPLLVGLRATVAAQGTTSEGEPLRAGTVVYTASLSKQVTAACAALLVQQGRLDLDSPLLDWLPELPAWAARVRVRHLVHHTSGMPDLDFEELEARGCDRTGAVVLEALAGTELVEPPGRSFRYCNAGYVCLGRVVERVTGQELPQLAQERVLGPLGMASTRFWSGPGPHPPGAAPTAPGLPAALSLGDGGMWSTAGDLLRWGDALERDELGVSGLLHTPGRLDDGTELDYAWGIGVRERGGTVVHRHGGRWAGLTAQLVRVPGRGSGVVLALDDDEARTGLLADALLDDLLGRP